jgi:hypothetical protein
MKKLALIAALAALPCMATASNCEALLPEDMDIRDCQALFDPITLEASTLVCGDTIVICPSSANNPYLVEVDPQVEDWLADDRHSLPSWETNKHGYLVQPRQ